MANLKLTTDHKNPTWRVLNQGTNIIITNTFELSISEAEKLQNSLSKAIREARKNKNRGTHILPTTLKRQEANI
jgi:hypothetical protein